MSEEQVEDRVDSESVKKRVRRHRARGKKKNKGNGCETNDKQNDKQENKKEMVDNNNKKESKESKSNWKKTKSPNMKSKKSSTIGITVALKKASKASKASNASANAANAARANRQLNEKNRNENVSLDNIMSVENKKMKDTNGANESKQIETMLTEDDILQAVLMQSLQESGNNNITGNVTANETANEKASNQVNESELKRNDKKEENGKSMVDSDYLIAMSLQENEESEYMSQKQEQERISGNKFAKVQSVDQINENSLKFYYQDGSKKYENKNDNSGKDKIDESLFEWSGGHIDTAGTKLRHDKQTWSKKHVSRMNDYSGIGTSINPSITIGNQAYNSFCKAVEKKGFKKEYM